MHHKVGSMAAAIALFVTPVAAVGCGSDDSGGGGGDKAPAASSDAPPIVAEANKSIDAASQPQAEWAGPDASPAPATGKTVYVISCSPDTEGCQRDVRAAVDAIKTMGWTAKRLDSDGTPANFAGLMDQAINAGADGIIDASFPTAAIQEQIDTAAKKGIPVVSMLSGNAPPDIGADFKGGFFTEVDTSGAKQGQLAADWIIAKTNGKAEIGLINEPAFPIQNQRVEAFKKRFAECEGCKLHEDINIPVAKLASDATPAITNFLRSNPNVNYFWATYDGAGVFAVQAVKEAGVADKVPIIGVDGNSPNLKFIKDGNVQVASVVSPHEWIGWAAVDQMNRAFAGEPPAKEWFPTGGGIPTKILTKENLPAEANFQGDLDYQAKFKELWGK